ERMPPLDARKRGRNHSHCPRTSAWKNLRRAPRCAGPAARAGTVPRVRPPYAAPPPRFRRCRTTTLSYRLAALRPRSRRSPRPARDSGERPIIRGDRPAARRSRASPYNLLFDPKELPALRDQLAVVGDDADDRSAVVALDFVEELHRLEHAEHVSGLDAIANLY